MKRLIFFAILLLLFLVDLNIPRAAAELDNYAGECSNNQFQDRCTNQPPVCPYNALIPEDNPKCAPPPEKPAEPIENVPTEQTPPVMEPMK